MEPSTTETIIAVILIAWGVLEIILFFKIWGMTNNVKKLKKDKALDIIDAIDKARYLYFIGDVDGAYDMLNIALYIQLKKVYVSVVGDEAYQEKKNKAIEVFTRYYQGIGREIPERLLNTTEDDFEVFSTMGTGLH